MQKYYAHADSVKVDPKELDVWVEVYLADKVDAFMSITGLTKLTGRIVELERALHQIKNGCVDDDDVANELFRSSPGEIRKIANAALAGGPVP